MPHLYYLKANFLKMFLFDFKGDLNTPPKLGYINPKKAGSFDPISQPGGGGGFHPPPPLGTRPRSGEKLCNLAHT